MVCNTSTLTKTFMCVQISTVQNHVKAFSAPAAPGAWTCSGDVMVTPTVLGERTSLTAVSTDTWVCCVMLCPWLCTAGDGGGGGGRCAV